MKKLPYVSMVIFAFPIVISAVLAAKVTHVNPLERPGKAEALQQSIDRLQVQREQVRDEVRAMRQEKAALQQQISDLRTQTNRATVTISISLPPGAAVKLEKE